MWYRVDHEHLGQQTSLTVPDDNHVTQRWVSTSGIDLGDCVAECVTQQRRRIRDRIAGVISEEPKLKMCPYPCIAQQLVCHVGPASGAGRGTMDEYHGKPAWPVWSNSGQPGRRLVEDVTHEKSAQLLRPNVCCQPDRKPTWWFAQSRAEHLGPQDARSRRLTGDGFQVWHLPYPRQGSCGDPRCGAPP